ncbi:MAG TPA: hypothetical protein PL059_14500 [Spirochaetota bacterium]|nr:hypothetical protein [Spirochaetota bacterium]HOM10769.1 hypothetical protein [Spirochaetota bacterium]HPP50682.1 hypothetical protein [Spirochaetota bacterium]
MKKMYYVLGAIAALTLLYFAFFHKSDTVQSRIDYIKNGGVVPPVNMLLQAFQADEELRARLQADFDMQDVVQYFREKYGKTIHHKHTQVMLVEKLMGYLMKMYPDDWVVYMYAMLREIFPGMENEIFDTFEKLHKYNTWLEENEHDLAQLNSKDKRNALWEKRYEIFGQDADQVWEAEKRIEPIYNALDTIQESDMPFNEKLSLYKQSIQEAYKSNTDTFVARKQQELMNSFLDVESVQKDLANMTPQERKENLKEVRKAMGLDSAALQRWEELDQVRDQRWDAGMQYMQQRAELEKKYTGAELEKQLDSLRMKYFGDEAETIKNEEESGYYRFSQPRKYGLE